MENTINWKMTSLLNKTKTILLFFAILFFANNIAFSKDAEIPDVPNPPRLVSDFARILSENKKQILEDKLVAYNDSTSTQIAIVSVNTVGDYAIDDFGIRLARKWGIGQKDKDNGILILIAKDDRKVDIEVGSRLEGLVSNYDCQRIIQDLMIPAFKQSNYFEGLDDATNRMMALLNGTFKSEKNEYSTTTNNESSGNTNYSSSDEPLPLWAIVLFIFVIIILISIFSKGGGGGYTGSSGGWVSSGGSWSGSSSGSSGGFSGFGGGGFSGGGGSGSW
ncbi:MAG: TPM domain-containing protein [Chitinophagales bacterium]